MMKEETKASILVVDDEKEIRNNLSRHFKYLGYSVEAAENGVEALNLLVEKRFDIIITDIIMPKMNGVDLLKEVRDRYPTIQTIVITGYITVENLMAALKYGADTCIFKPILDMKELERAVINAKKTIDHWRKKVIELKGLEKNLASQEDSSENKKNS